LPEQAARHRTHHPLAASLQLSFCHNFCQNLWLLMLVTVCGPQRLQFVQSLRTTFMWGCPQELKREQMEEQRRAAAAARQEIKEDKKPKQAAAGPAPSMALRTAASLQRALSNDDDGMFWDYGPAVGQRGMMLLCVGDFLFSIKLTLSPPALPPQVLLTAGLQLCTSFEEQDTPRS